MAARAADDSDSDELLATQTDLDDTARPRPATSSIPPLAMDEIGELARQVRLGLLKRPRVLPTRWMFDEVGAALYDAWLHLPECGLGRAEERLLARNADRIAAALPATTDVVELGPGAGARVAPVLDALARRQSLAYTAVEVSGATLRRGLQELGPIASVRASGFVSPSVPGLRRALADRTGGALVLWLGAGIGWIDPPVADATLAAIRAELAPGDAVLLGVDLLKHDTVLVRAYDDPAGVAAAFTRASLARINRELAGELDPRDFRHEARWHEPARRIELHLVAVRQVHAKVHGAGITVRMDAGETIWTASAYKALPPEPGALGARTGFVAAGQWLDPTWPYALTLLVAQ